MTDRSVVYRLRAEVGSFRASLAQASASTKKFGDDLLAIDAKGDKMRRGLSGIADVGGKVGLVAAGGLAAATKAAVDWESAWAGVQKTTDGTASQMAELEGQLREMARTMPATHQEIAATAEAAGQLGVAREDVAAFTETMIKLGATTNVSADQAATSIAQIQNVMGTAPEDIDNFAAALVDLGNNGASTESQILDMAQRISGAGAQIGLAETDILAISNAVASMGIEAEAGGSAVSTAFTKMAMAVSSGGPKLEKFAEVAGTSTTEFQRMFKETPAEAFAAFTQGLDRINKSGGDVFGTLKDIGLSDIRVSQAMLSLAASGDVLTDSLAMGAEAWEKNSALSDEFAKRSGTTAAEVQVAWNNVKDAGIELGSVMLPVLSEAADVVTGVTNAFQSLPGPVKSATAGALGLTAVFGGGLWFTAKVIGGVVNMKQSLADLGVQASTTRSRLTLLNGVKLTGLTAAAAVGIPLLSNDLDTLGRSIANTKASTEGLDGVLEALNKSNVGKYADDLGINMQKLAEDLYANGASGEYVGETYDKLNGKLDSFGDNAKEAITYWLPGITSGQNKAAEVNKGLNKVIEENGNLLGKAESDAKAAALAQGELTGATLSSADAANLSAAETEEMAKALKDARDGASETARSFLTLGESLNNPKVSLGDWIGEMEKQARALREFTANSKKAAKEGLDDGLIASLQEAGVEGALRLEQLANASDAEIRRANKAFRSGQNASDAYADAVEVLARRLLGLPPVEKVDVKVNTANAKAALRSFQAQIDALRGKNITVSTTFKNFYTNVKGPKGNRGGVTDPWRGPLENPADGGTIPRPGGRLIRSASGSTVPDDGGGYRDYLPYLLAPGEEVISNRVGQADRFRPLLKAINAGRLADGGTAGKNPTWMSAIGGSWGEAFELPKTLKGLNKALKRSKASLEDETDARDELASKMSSLQDAVAGKLASDLFGETEAWSAGGSFEDVMAILAGDIATGTQMQKDIAALQKKGLNGGALDALLAQGDAATIGRFAGLTPAQLAQYEKQYERRDNLATSTGKSASAAAYGPEFKVLDSSARRLEGKVGAIEKAIDRNGKKDRDSRKRGKGNAARNRKKG
ncbi:hypothetical protein NSI01_55370 [Pimelobacter simplex]|nr:hypothetical protein NSI01_55370 [Pimelobacter simplex]